MAYKLCECLACEGMFHPHDAMANGVPEEYIETFCTVACQEAMLHELELGAQVSEAMNLDTSEFQSPTNTSLRDALSKVGFKINVNKENK